MNSILKKFDLSKKVAIVTGAAGLLGEQHCMALAEVGAIVVVTDLKKPDALLEKLQKQFPENKFLATAMDVTSRSSVESVHQEILKNFNRVDILVNNAAIDPKVKNGEGLVESSRFENFSVDQWNFQISVGLTGALICSQVFGSWMAANGGGNILNIASDLSVIAPDQRLYRKEGLSENLQPVKPVTYSVIKSGLVGMTKYMAAYWATQNIRVNAISPGGVYNQQPEGFVEKLSQLIPMGRMANREEYRSTIQYLCSDASSYMTGQNIVIDGGRSII